MHLVSCNNTHHDVTDLVNHEMVKNVKTLIPWERNITFLQNKKIHNLCLRWHILRSYHFVAEVSFKGHTQRIGFPDEELYAESFQEKFIKIKYSGSSLGSENSQCGRQQPYNFSSWRFQDTCGQLRKTKIGWLEADELAVTGEKNFPLSQKKRFLEPLKKKNNLYR